MEKFQVIALLEKYWQAETTIAEEEALTAYFRGAHVDPELAAYREMFSYFHEEAQVSAGPDFGNRILQRLGLPPDGDETAHTRETPVIPMTRQAFRWGVVGAAAAILLIVASLFLLGPGGQPTILADSRLAGRTQPGMTMPENRVAGRTDIADTYDDPDQALAAVRHALLVVSRNLNQSRREITGTSK